MFSRNGLGMVGKFACIQLYQRLMGRWNGGMILEWWATIPTDIIHFRNGGVGNASLEAYPTIPRM